MDLLVIVRYHYVSSCLLGQWEAINYMLKSDQIALAKFLGKGSDTIWMLSSFRIVEIIVGGT